MCSSRRRIQKLSICKLEARILLFWREDPNLTLDGPYFFYFFFLAHSSKLSQKERFRMAPSHWGFERATNHWEKFK